METTAHETNEINPVSTLSSGIISSRNDKRERKHTAQTLPQGITHNMMKKFVVYYREMMYLKNGKRMPREYFKVESHPRLNKPWVSSKSMKISIIEKLNDANQVVDDLEELDSKDAAAAPEDLATIFERTSKQLPKYTMLRIVKDTPEMTTLSLVYDRKDNSNGFRWTCSYTFSVIAAEISTSNNNNIEAHISLGIDKLREKLQEKYAVDLLSV
jgi:hypothetical protein